LKKSLVNGIDPIDKRMLDSLLKDDLNVILDKNVDNLEVLSKSDQDGRDDGLDQQFMLAKLIDSLLKNKANLEKFQYFHD
jgi:hypothetical protein